MKKTFKILISGIAALAAFGFAGTAAAAPLEVVWSKTPLFSVSNFAPGQSSEGSFEVKNDYAEAKEVYVEAVQAIDQDNLGSQMRIEIFDGDASIYNKSFEEFLKAGPIPLSDVAPGLANDYKMKVTFLDKSDNDDYQGKSLSFDICVGFWGGETRCTKEQVIDPDPNGNTKSGGGGGSSGGMHLVIYNDRNDEPLLSGEQGSIVVRWETNKLATSQVIYGLASGSFQLDLEAENFGYSQATPETASKTMDHVVVLSGLKAGETYVYRVVSRASPPTVSYEHEFTVPSGSHPIVTAGSGNSVEEGRDGDGLPQVEGEIAGAFDENLGGEMAAVISSGSSGLLSNWWFWVIIILLISFVIWKLFRKSREV